MVDLEWYSEPWVAAKSGLAEEASAAALERPMEAPLAAWAASAASAAQEAPLAAREAPSAAQEAPSAVLEPP